MERSAFARAWEYVGFVAIHKWTAMLAAAASGASYVLLLLLLGLFTDLLVTRGVVPSFSDLNDAQRTRFRQRWNELSDDDRQSALAALPIAESVRAGLKKPIESEDDPQSVRWTAYVGRLLEQRSGVDAAETYRQRAVVHPGLPAGANPEHVQLGTLSSVVRSRESFVGPVIGWAAGWNSWTWRPSETEPVNRTYLLGLLIIALSVAALRLGLVLVMHHSASRATLDAVTRLRRLLYHHTYRLGSLTVARDGTGEAVSAFVRHVDTVHDGLYSRLTLAVRDPIKVLFLVVFALCVNVWLAFAALFAAALVWLIGRQTATFFRRRGREGARRAANQLSLLEESLQMMRLVKGYLMDLFNQGRVERQLSEYTRAQLQRFRGELVYRPLLIFLGTIAGGGLLFVGGWEVLTDHLSMASLLVLGAAVCSMYFPIDTWLAQRRLIHRAEESAVALFEFLDRKSDVGQVVGAEFLNAISRSLDFDQVSMREPGAGEMIFHGLTMSIPAGKRVAIVGVEQSGREAIASLIPRFLDPTAGEVRIDNKNLRWVTLDSLRAQVGLVMQDHPVFNDTIANNIGCGDPSYTLPQIIEAAKAVHAHHFIQKLPYGYETRIGGLGSSLSAGERFRIGLARAFLRDPAILVIEEPRETLDEGTKRLLDDAFARILPGRTVILFPHRLSTLKSCDLVYVIRDGQLAAEGGHRELLRDNEMYRHLYYQQYYVLAEAN